MLNIVWMTLLGLGFFVGIINGNTEDVGNALINGATNAIEFSMGILGIVAFWCGMMNILQEAGAVSMMGKILSPVIDRLFPEAKNNLEVKENLISNISANFLGLGNAATPYGIKTVKLLQGYSSDPETAGKSVCLFLVINSAAFQLLPTTIIAMRARAGCSEPSSILLPVWIVSIISLIVAVGVFYLFSLRKRCK